MEDFFDRFHAITGISKYSNSEVITPLNIVKDMVDLLPADVFNPDTKFLDPAVKSGRFLAEIYRRLFDSSLLSHMNEADRKEHILKNQLFGIATSAAAAAIVRKQLYADATIAGNIVYVDRYLTLMTDKGTDFRKLIEKEFGQMKFDVVIGNPPYQHNDGGGGRGNKATDIFDKFVIFALRISGRYTVMITPSKWYNKESLTEMKTQLISDKHLGALTHFPHSNDVFDADIGGGVSYFLHDKKTQFDNAIIKNITKQSTNAMNRSLCIGDNVILDNKVYHIIEQTIGEKCFVPASGDNPFGIGSNVYGSPVQEREDDVILVKGQSAFYLERSGLRSPELIDKYKCTIGKMNPDRGGVNGSTSWNVINVPKMLKPGYVIPQNFMVLYANKDPQQVINFWTYIKTKFARFLVLQAMAGVSLASPDNWKFLPEQDFSHHWTDQMLYEKYGLSTEEIEYIENTIKPME